MSLVGMNCSMVGMVICPPLNVILWLNCACYVAFVKLYYSLKPDDRIFPVTKYYLNHEMERGCKASGVKKIRVHDLRHSHVSLLINMGYTALAIGKRVGHSAEKITYRYAHLFPSVQQDMAEQLDAENMDKELNEVEGGLANVG